MDAEAIHHYASERSRRGPAPGGSFSGSAGGAPCGDLIRISLLAGDGQIERVTFEAQGCAASIAAASATAELAEGGSALEAAGLGPGEIATSLGGLNPTHAHSAELAADALHRALSALAGSGQPLAKPAADWDAPKAPGEAAGGGEPPGRVLVALSGGVDSAVAALMERERGAEVVGVTLKLWADRATDGERSCCSPEAVIRARHVAHSMGLPHLTLDLEEPFRRGVVKPFIDGYAAGRTPNPCVLCNGDLRIDAMIALADRLGAAALATGHYARIVDDGEGPLLAKPGDAAKDQTYMLAALRPSAIRRLRFPLGELTKPEVREIAARAGLEVAGRAESQDLCFLAGQGKRGFLRRHAALGERPGEIVDPAGRRLGTHEGQHNFTVGQRRGLGLASGNPLYVLETDGEANRVVVGSRDELRTRRVRIRGARLHRRGERVNAVRLRYHAPQRSCTLEPDPDGPGEATIALDEAVDAVAPGQVACLMDGDLVVGHGTIT